MIMEGWQDWLEKWQWLMEGNHYHFNKKENDNGRLTKLFDLNCLQSWDRFEVARPWENNSVLKCGIR